MENLITVMLFDLCYYSKYGCDDAWSVIIVSGMSFNGTCRFYGTGVLNTKIKMPHYILSTTLIRLKKIDYFTELGKIQRS